MVKVTEAPGNTGNGKFTRIRNGESVAPSFARTLGVLGNAELLEEIAGGRGGADFQEAARAEARVRGLEG